MELIPAKCPGCGAALQAPADRDRFFCSFCGQVVLVDRGSQSVAEQPIGNWMSLARAAAIAGNHEEAYKYYTQALEYEPENYEAWLGKGEAAGWSSTLAKSRLSEMIVAVKQAVQHAPEPKTAISVKAAHFIDAVTTVLFYASEKHRTRYSSVRDVNEKHCLRCFQLLDAYDVAQELDVHNRDLVQHAIDVCYFVIRYVRPSLHPYTVKSLNLDQLKNRRSVYVAKMRALDPDYKEQKV